MMAGGRIGTGAVEAAAWWLVLVAGYLLLISTVTVVEFAVGAFISALAGVAAVVARRASGSRFAVGTTLRLLAYVPASVLADTVLLVRVLVAELGRRGTPAGRMRTVPLASPGETAAENTWTAVAAGTMSMAPGTYALDTHRGSLLVHALRDEPDRLERAVRP